MALCKLTDEHHRTCNNTQWGPGVRHEATGPIEGELCTDSWIHYYSHPLLAVLLNPIHANFVNPVGWAVMIEGPTRDDHGLKMGCRALTTLHQIDLPVVTTMQRVRFAIFCAQAVIGQTIPVWARWAEKWLDGTDRTTRAAEEAAAAEAAAEAARAAAWAAAWAAEAAAA